MLVEGGTIRFMDVMTIANNITNLGSYSGPTLRPAISAKHFRVTLRNSGASRNYADVSMEEEQTKGHLRG